MAGTLFIELIDRVHLYFSKFYFNRNSIKKAVHERKAFEFWKWQESL